MDTAIHMGDNVTVDEQAVEARTDAIVEILDAGARHNTDEQTLRHALDKLEGAGRRSIDQATIKGCSVRMGADDGGSPDDPADADAENTVVPPSG